MIELLREAGIRVPHDIAEQSRWAAKTLMSMMAGERVPDEIVMPARMVLRRSCGCQDTGASADSWPEELDRTLAQVSMVGGSVELWKRVYKPSQSHEESSSIVREGRGTHFDPVVAGALSGSEAQVDDESSRRRAER